MMMRNMFPRNFPKFNTQCYMLEKKVRYLWPKTLNWCDSKSMKNKKKIKIKTNHRIHTRNGRNQGKKD